jgi:hypothetical protein
MPLCPHSKSECPHYKPRKTTKQTDPNIALFIQYYHDTYLSKFNTAPVIRNGQDAMIVKRLLNRWPLESLKFHLTEYFNDEKMFYAENGYDIARFDRYLAGQVIKQAKADTKWREPFQELLKSIRNMNGKLIVDNKLARNTAFNMGGSVVVLSLFNQPDGVSKLEKAFKEAFYRS